MNILIIAIVVFMLLILSSMFICHFSLDITKYVIKSNKLGNELNNFKIIHLSDLHSREFRNKNEYFITKIKKEKPNIIVMTGDMVNGKKNNILEFEKLIKKMNKICDIYYVMGNREFRYTKEQYKEFKNMLILNNIKVLENSHSEIKANGKDVHIYGLNYFNRDAKQYYSNRYTNLKSKTFEAKKAINELLPRLDRDKYNILLTHSPYDFKLYSEYGFDLILCGHIHGGIIRLPFFGRTFISRH